jgi:hypothetical protein
MHESQIPPKKVEKKLRKKKFARQVESNPNSTVVVIPDISNWNPEDEDYINVPIEECNTKDVVNQRNFAELKYLNMTPPCEETSKGYCGIRRNLNITFISKFLTKNYYNEQFRVRVHLVDKHFGFETAVWLDTI